MIEDSILFQSLIESSERVVKYKLSGDSLIVYTQDSEDFKSLKEKNLVWKYKILNIDSMRLTIERVYPIPKDTIRFRRLTLERRNDLKINELEFSASICFGSCPALDLKISRDSILYFYGYKHTEHQGLYKYKLDSLAFDRIQEKIFAIPRDSLFLGPDGPDQQSLNLFIRTPTDSIEFGGTLGYGNQDRKVTISIIYLLNLEHFLDLKIAEDKSVSFRDKINYNFFKKE
jgi:hypothetical protein